VVKEVLSRYAEAEAKRLERAEGQRPAGDNSHFSGKKKQKYAQESDCG
jgi:hypothetical protein